MISLEIREISDHSAFVAIVRGQKLSAGLLTALDAVFRRRCSRHRFPNR